MDQKRKAMALLSSLVILLSFFPGQVKADITGNTYWFTATWLEQTYQQNGGTEFESSISGEFKITVLNATESGGDDVYEYIYQGFSWHLVPYHINQTSSVEFQENKVSFEIETEDEDNDNRAETAQITIFPSFHHSIPGHRLFVNPIWSTHNTGWNTAVDDTESQNTTAQLTESAGGGSFSLRIVIDIESESEEYGQMNGTRVFDFEALYDSDGILRNWDLTSTTRLSNQNHTSNNIITQRYSRTTDPGGFGIGDEMATTLGVVGVAGTVGLVVGVLLAKKYWS